MFWSLIFWISPCAAAVLSVSVLQPPRVSESRETVPIAPQSLLAPNISLVLKNATSPPAALGGILKIACNADLYGKNLKVKSCERLFGYILKDRQQRTFAERDSGIPHDTSLPIRTYSDDGLCFMQPILAKDAVVGKASIAEVGMAAYTMLTQCVKKQGKGGLAYNLGGNNKMNVVISAYKPNVKCESAATDVPDWQSCVGIFTNMKASKRSRVFGASDDDAVQEELPFVLQAADEKCQFAIDIKGKDTVASWYEIWEAVGALASMCVRPLVNGVPKYKGGKARGIGKDKNMFIEVSVAKPHTGTQVGAASNVSSIQRSAALEDLQPLHPGAYLSDFERIVAFELVESHSDGDGSLVSAAGGLLTNISHIAIA